MGGTSSTSQTQSSSTTPWATGQTAVNGILGQLSPLIANSGITPGESSAITQLQQNASAGNPYATAIGNNATSLLAGGGAQNEAGAVNQNYQNYYNQTQPLASNTNYNPYSTPGFSDAVNTMTGDITNSVNGQFAAAGRNMSGMNTQTLARGLTQGIAPTIAAQYNSNVANQQGAASNLFGAGNTTTNSLTGMQTQANANTQTGTQAAADALSAQNYGPSQQLALQQLLQQIPAQNLGLLSQIGIPIAGLGTTSTGTAQGTADMSGAQQFGTIASGTGNLLKGLFG